MIERGKNREFRKILMYLLLFNKNPGMRWGLDLELIDLIKIKILIMFKKKKKFRHVLRIASRFF